MESLIDKEELVKKLLEDDKNFQEIAKTAHVSFSFISVVKKKMMGEDIVINKRLSIPTQAIKLFSEGKSIIDVIITLDRPSVEICKYYDDYLRLKNRGYLVSLIGAYEDALPTLVKLIKYMVQNPSTKNDLIATLGLVKDIPRLKSVKKNLEEKIKDLNEARNQLLNNGGRMNQY